MDRRKFLTIAAGAASALAAPTYAAAPLDGAVTRLDDNRTLRIDWTDANDPTRIFISNDPDTPKRATRLIMGPVLHGTARIEAPVSPRPYFLLRAMDGSQTRVAERLLPLQGGRNFRDLGGYRAEDGRQVRWGRIYRSGVMTGLTAADLDYLGKLGVAVVCDLRSPQERAAEPSPFLKVAGADVVTFDYDMSTSLEGFSQIKTRAQAIAGFAAAYLRFIDTLTPNYTDMFARLVKADGPLAMNCSAGKDRTGVGSALVLSTLGVPRETVIADYALTQVYTPPSFYIKQMASSGTLAGLTSAQAQAFARMPPEVLDVMMGSDPDVMRQTLAAIDQKFGGPIPLVKSRFGLSDEKIARLRSLYLA